MGDFAEYGRHDAIGLAELVRKGEVSAAELLEAAIARCEARNPAINAVVTRMYEQARRAVGRGLPSGALSGVPFLLKDLHAHYSGVATTYGSRLFADAVADHDTEMTLRYKRVGLVIFGKTNTPELGLSVSTEPRLFGATRNPWHLDHIAGGSSGGAAAAVAAGIVPAAHGTDGGGSIRIPASCCGLFGLKPTRGRNPMGPDVGEGWSGMSAQHVLTRSVRDSAALLDATSGPDVGDPYWAPPPARPFLEEVGADPGRLRIAVWTEAPRGVRVDPECRRAALDAAALCRELGHEVSEARPELDAEGLRQSTTVIIGANVDAVLRQRADALGRELRDGDVEGVTLRLAELGRRASASDYAAAIKTIHAAGRALGRLFTESDALLTPMVAKPPIRLGVLDMSTSEPEEYARELEGLTAFSTLFNATGQPAMSVPLHWTEEGLPVGVQVAGRFGDEATLLRLAAQLEAARPWAERRPPLRE